MVGEAVGVGVCLFLWGTRACLAAKYVVKYRVGQEPRRAWKPATPEWVTRIMPWLEFLGWVALLGCLAWWIFHPAPVGGSMALARITMHEFGIIIHT